MIRSFLILCSAAASAALCIFAWRSGADLPFATVSALGITAPIAGVALAFPAVYLLWEQSEL